jgi:hypothetical protein
MLQEDGKSGEEARINNRMERLGKEISVLKVKVTECSTTIEEVATRQTGLGEAQLAGN